MTDHHILHVGGGIQSTTLHLRFFLDELPQKLDCTLFADTGGESQPLYRHLQLLQSFAGPYNYAVGAPNLANDLAGSNELLSHLPAHTIDSPGAACRLAEDFKLEATIRKIREILGVKGRQPFPCRKVSVNLYLAVTYDQCDRAELIRRRLAEYRWLKPVFPLIERKMTLWDCRRWLRDYGRLPLPVPKSGCIFCPHRSNKEWSWLRKHDRAGFERAAEIDDHLRHPDPDLNSPRYLHHSCVPLRKADLDAPEAPADQSLPGFNHECEGMCGL